MDGLRVEVRIHHPDFRALPQAIVEVQCGLASVAGRDLRLGCVQPEDLDPVFVVTVVQALPVELARVCLGRVINVTLGRPADIATIVVVPDRPAISESARTDRIDIAGPCRI